MHVWRRFWHQNYWWLRFVLFSAFSFQFHTLVGVRIGRLFWQNVGGGGAAVVSNGPSAQTGHDLWSKLHAGEIHWFQMITTDSYTFSFQIWWIDKLNILMLQIVAAHMSVPLCSNWTGGKGSMCHADIQSFEENYIVTNVSYWKSWSYCM